MKRYIILFLLGALALLSCKKHGNSYIYKNAEMGIVDNKVFTTDGGVKMNIISAPEDIDVVTRRRVLILYELHLKEENNYAYNIIVLDLVEPVYISSILKETPEAEPDGDPVSVYDGWFSGGYLNLCLLYHTDPKKEAEQTFSFYHGVNSKLVTFAVRRDGQGENYFSVTDPEKQYTYLSIPMEPIWQDYLNAAEGGVLDEDRSMSVNLTWRWHAVSSSTGDYIKEIISYNMQGTYYPDM